jgi:metallo-beta-lactamase family protein
MAKLTFLGATGTVTGSKYLVEANGKLLLVDCGLYQGNKELRLRNWEHLPEDPASIDWVVLTHAHIDHSGYLPRLIRDGFAGPVFCNSATRDLCAILLPDSARLQEEDAEHAAFKGFSKHKQPLPLYTVEEAEAAIARLRVIPRGQPVRISSEFTVRLLDAGHILGSAMIELTITENGKKTVVLFSGDLGRYDQPILNDPDPPGEADYLLCESTYGDREHPTDSPHDALEEIINRVTQRGGSVVIPAFAVGRTQTLLYVLRQLEDWQRIPMLPVFVDSPMAIHATELYLKHHEDHDLEFIREEISGHPLSCRHTVMALSRDASREINKFTGPCLILSASGMATGGRVLYHLARRICDARNAVLLPGFQAEGTRGRALLEGARTLRIHGEGVPVKAEVIALNQFSAHADRGEILRWLGGFPKPPRETFVVHGEPAAARTLRAAIAERFHWPAIIPEYRQSVQLQA